MATYEDEFFDYVSEVHKQYGGLEGRELLEFAKEHLGVTNTSNFYKWKNRDHASYDTRMITKLAALTGLTGGQLLDRLNGVTEAKEHPNMGKFDPLTLRSEKVPLAKVLQALQICADRLKSDFSTYEYVSNSLYSNSILSEAEVVGMAASRVQRLRAVLSSCVPAETASDRFLELFGGNDSASDYIAIRNIYDGIEVEVNDELLSTIAYYLRELTSDEAINTAWLRSRIDTANGGNSKLTDAGDRQPRSPGRIV